MLDPRAGLDAPRDVLRPRRRDRRARRARRARAPPTAEIVEGAGRHLLPGLRRPARAPAHARPGAQGGPRDRHARRGRRRLLRRARDAEHRPGGRLGAAAALAARRGRARGARSRSASCRRSPAAWHGERADRDGRAARRGRARLHRRRPAGRSAPGCCARRCSTSGCAAACSRCTRRTRRCRGSGAMHEGEVSAAARRRRDPVDQRVDDGRPRRRARRLRGRPHPHPAPLARASRSRRVARRQGARRRASPARRRRTTCCLTDEAVRTLDTRMKMNPPLRTEDDRQALDRRACATGTIDCIATDHAPHARDEKEVPFEQAPMGTTGLETAFAALYTELVAARRPAPRARSSSALTAGAALFGLPIAADRRRRARRTSRSSTSTREWVVGRARLRAPLGELLLRRAHAARPRPADGRGRRGRVPRARARGGRRARSATCSRPRRAPRWSSSTSRRASASYGSLRRRRAACGRTWSTGARHPRACPVIATEQYPQGPRAHRARGRPATGEPRDREDGLLAPCAPTASTSPAATR